MSENNKIDVILKYRPELKALLEDIRTDIPQAQMDFFDEIDANPKIAEQSLRESLYARFNSRSTPFDDENANEIYRRLRHESDAKAEEFKEAYELLGDTLDLDQFNGSTNPQQEKPITIESFSARDDLINSSEDKQVNKSKLFEIYGVSNTGDLMSKLDIKYSEKNGYIFNGRVFNDVEDAIRVAYNNRSMLQDSPKESNAEIETYINGWGTSPTPWRRYAARVFDIVTNGSIGVFLFSFIFYSTLPVSADKFFDNLNPAVDIIVTSLLATVITGIIIGFSGLSIGKWIFGLKVTMPNGSPIGVWNGLKRDFSVFMRGLGFGIPLVSLITMIIGYNTLTKEGSSSWDSDGGYVVSHRPSGWKQYLLNTIGIFIIIMVIGFLRALERISA